MARSAPSGDLRNVSLTIDAQAMNEPSAETTLPIVRSGSITILQSPGPVVQGTDLGGSYSHGNTAESFGAVYSPYSADANQTLSVEMSAVGLIQNGSLIPIPAWMQVDLSELFVLNTMQPYYFDVGVTTNRAHFGAV